MRLYSTLVGAFLIGAGMGTAQACEKSSFELDSIKLDDIGYGNAVAVYKSANCIEDEKYGDTIWRGGSLYVTKKMLGTDYLKDKLDMDEQKHLYLVLEQYEEIARQPKASETIIFDDACGPLVRFLEMRDGKAKYDAPSAYVEVIRPSMMEDTPTCVRSVEIVQHASLAVNFDYYVQAMGQTMVDTVDVLLSQREAAMPYLSPQ